MDDSDNDLNGSEASSCTDNLGQLPPILDESCVSFLEHVAGAFPAPIPDAFSEWMQSLAKLHGLQRSALWRARRMGRVTSSRLGAAVMTNLLRVADDFVDLTSDNVITMVDMDRSMPMTATLCLDAY